MNVINEFNAMAKIAINKSVLKEYRNGDSERVVYLDNGSEFQIQLFNPYTYTIGAEISINGEKENGLIVIRPGERVWIERPLGKNKKYKFETYEIENSSAAINATKNNGQVQISFYRECQKTYVPSFGHDQWLTDIICDPLHVEINSSPYNNNGHTINPKLLIDNNINYYSDTHTRCASATLCNSNIDCANGNVTSCLTTNTVSNGTIETGRISTGSVSSQHFSQSGIEFNSWSFKTEGITILPMSRKPYTSTDLQKVYCTECGRKLNPKFKYCPYCGAKCE